MILFLFIFFILFLIPSLRSEIKNKIKIMSAPRV